MPKTIRPENGIQMFLLSFIVIICLAISYLFLLNLSIQDDNDLHSKIIEILGTTISILLAIGAMFFLDRRDNILAGQSNISISENKRIDCFNDAIIVLVNQFWTLK